MEKYSKIMKIDIMEAINFLDRKSPKGLASSIISVIGEELNACAFQDYLKNQEENSEVIILAKSVTNGTKKKGETRYLDKWIYVKKQDGKQILYQCEIKNWAANAIGAYKEIKNEASEEKILEEAEKMWKNKVMKDFIGERSNGVTKVLLNMSLKNLPEEYKKIEEIRPIVLYWMLLSKNLELQSFFKEKLSNFPDLKIKTDFEEVYFFSTSIYLRSLLKKSKYLECESELLKTRLNTLNKICINN